MCAWSATTSRDYEARGRSLLRIRSRIWRASGIAARARRRRRPRSRRRAPPRRDDDLGRSATRPSSVVERRTRRRRRRRRAAPRRAASRRRRAACGRASMPPSSGRRKYAWPTSCAALRHRGADHDARDPERPYSAARDGDVDRQRDAARARSASRAAGGEKYVRVSIRFAPANGRLNANQESASAVWSVDSASNVAALVDEPGDRLGERDRGGGRRDQQQRDLAHAVGARAPQAVDVAAGGEARAAPGTGRSRRRRRTSPAGACRSGTPCRSPTAPPRRPASRASS